MPQPPARSDDGVLAALRRLFTPSPQPPAPKGVLDTPYADSVFALGGRPATVAVKTLPHGDGGAKLFGQYTPIVDRLELDRLVGTRDPERPAYRSDVTSVPRHVLAHEEGHRLDPALGNRAVPSQDPGLRTAFDAYLRNHPDKRPSDYAASSGVGGREHFAEAFADAVTALQNTGVNDARATADPAAAKFGVDMATEGMQPGADTLAVELLKRPLYGKHPLRPATRNKDRRV